MWTLFPLLSACTKRILNSFSLYANDNGILRSAAQRYIFRYLDPRITFHVVADVWARPPM